MMKKFLLFLTTILLVISLSCVFADENDSSEENTENESSSTETADGINDSTDAFQWVITDLCLSIGDFLNNLITKVVGQKITIQDLIFNKVDAVNANFFKTPRQLTSVHSTVRTQITKWYETFREIAVIIYLAAVLAFGIKIVLSGSPMSRADAKDLIVKWITGVLILFVFNYVMKYAFEINDSFVQTLCNKYGDGQKTGSYVGERDIDSNNLFEFRSPEYRSQYSNILSFGGNELNNAYTLKLEEYRANADMMRVMRAYAGVSHRIIFCIIWFVLLFQLIILLVKYYKRYFILALLITVFPFVAVYYLVDAIKGKNCEVLRMWCVEFFVNVFTQSIHAIIYVIIASVCIQRVSAEMVNGSNMNWLIIICAINFIFQGEKIVRKLLGADGSMSDRGIGETARAGNQMRGRAMSNARAIRGAFRGGKK